MISKKTLLTYFILSATVITLAGGSSWADERGVNPEVYGTWDMLEIKNLGMTLQLTLTIKENEVIGVNNCYLGKYKVSARTASPAVITPNEIRVLEASEAIKEYSPGFLRCRASLDVGELQYQLRDGKLILYAPEEEETFECTRSGGQFKAAKRYKKSKDPKAAKGYEKSRDPKVELAYTKRGTAYLKKGQYNEAIEEYNKAIKINPNYSLAYYNRSVAYSRIGQHDRALTDCNKVLQLDPKHAKSYYTRGVSYWHLGTKNQAIKDFQAAARLEHKGAQDFLSSNGMKW